MTHSEEIGPIRACCGQRHMGARCPDGLVMCCVCFDRVPISRLSSLDGRPQDVCLSCEPKVRTPTEPTDPVPTATRVLAHHYGLTVAEVTVRLSPAEPHAWSRFDQADHDAGHPSGRDCHGEPLASEHEVCAHRFPPVHPVVQHRRDFPGHSSGQLNDGTLYCVDCDWPQPPKPTTEGGPRG